MTSEVFNMDCMECMKQYPDNYFDLAIVDPPYGINTGKMTMGSGKHKFSKDKDWDSAIPTAEYFAELFRVSENQIVWGGNYFTEHLPPTPHWLLWDKKNPNLSFAEGELAWVRKGKNLRIFKHYSAMVEEGGKIHPTQKPVALYKWILHNYATCKECDGSGEVASLSIDCDVQTCKSCKGNVPKILDSHLGSGSSRIACDKAGFDFVGFELDKDYFDAQEKRFKQYKSQLTLF